MPPPLAHFQAPSPAGDLEDFFLHQNRGRNGGTHSSPLFAPSPPPRTQGAELTDSLSRDSIRPVFCALLRLWPQRGWRKRGEKGSFLRSERQIWFFPLLPLLCRIMFMGFLAAARRNHFLNERRIEEGEGEGDRGSQPTTDRSGKGRGMHIWLKILPLLGEKGEDSELTVTFVRSK